MPKLNKSEFSSLLAVLISLSALTVSLYEAHLMQVQQGILLDQQNASVWPFLEATNNFTSDKDGSYLNYSIINKGIGLAKINQATLLINGKTVSSYQELTEQIDDILRKHDDSYNLKELMVSFGESSGVMSSNESFNYLTIEMPKSDRFNASVIGSLLKVEYELCYCSVYKECWQFSALKNEISNGCN